MLDVGKIRQNEKDNALIISELPLNFRDSVGIPLFTAVCGKIKYFTDAS